MVVCIHKAMV